MAELVAKRYASALFDVAKELQKIDEFEEQVMQLRSILEQEEELMQVLQHPQILVDKKIELIQTVLEGKIADEIMGIFVLIIKKRRQAQMLEILDVFLDFIKNYKGMITAEVVSAIPLPNEQLTKIQQNIEQGMKKQVTIQTTIDPEIIGGLIIRVGDKVLDASIAGKMQSLKTQLMDLQLA